MGAISNTALTPLSFLERSAHVWPGKVAVIYGRRRLTYAEFAAEAARVAGALRASGVEPGDRVAYLMPNLPEMLVAHFAVPLAGGVLVAINTRLTAEEVSYILRHSGAKVLVADAALLPVAAAAVDSAGTAAQIVVATDAEAGPPSAGLAAGSQLVSYSEFLARQAGDPLPCSVPDELAPIAINYTSGTTGVPKGVIYTHRGAYLNSFAQIIHSRHDENSVYLWTLPMFHCNGWCAPWAVTAIGGTHVCLREVRGDAIWQQLLEHGITHMNARADRREHRPERERGRAAAPAGSDHHRRGAAEPHDDRGDGADGVHSRARLRADRDVRPDHPVPVPARLD